MEGADLVKGIPRSDRVHQEEAFACSHVLLAHGSVGRGARCAMSECVAPREALTPARRGGDSRVLFLTRGIQNIEQCDLFVNHALLPVRISVTRRRHTRSARRVFRAMRTRCTYSCIS